MKKILYVMTSLAHKRVFESLVPRKDCTQLAVGPKARITSAIVPEDYSDFKIPVREYTSTKQIQKIVNEFKPNVYAQSDLSAIQKAIKLPKGCKRAYISHGLIGNHVKGIIKKAAFNTSVWKGCDLYCGGTNIFSEWVQHVAGVGPDKIALNIVPQFDLLHDPNYYNSYRDKVLSKTKLPGADKVVLFIGMTGKNRFDFEDHNADYFGAAIKLTSWAEYNNALIMIKPRHTHKKNMAFLKSQKWGKHYVADYAALQNNKHVHFITTTGHIGRYMFADAIVVNGCSTVEVEACAMRKPLFLARTKIPGHNKMNMPVYDPYNMNASRAAELAIDHNELIHEIGACFDDGRYHRPENQVKLLKQMGLSCDGKMSHRLQKRLLAL